MKERQELYCHGCNRYVQFDIDVGLEGNHTITCPNCGHEHYRVVRAGVVTEVRWKSSGPTHQATNTATTVISTYTVYSSTGTNSSSTAFMYSSWMNTATA